MHLQHNDSLLATKGLATALQFLFKVVASMVQNQQAIRLMLTEGVRRASGNDPLTGDAAEQWRREQDNELAVAHATKQRLKDLAGVSPS